MHDLTPLLVEVRGRTYRAVDLRSAFGHHLHDLPWILRVIAENRLRHAPEAAASVRVDLLDWLNRGQSEAELPFHPVRVLMHDTTCGPALVDIAAMRDEIAEAGGDSRRLTPVLPCDVSVDHSVAVDHYAKPDAVRANMTREIERNAERYRLMRWAGDALPGFRIHPPGTGIMHTINLEQLATVIAIEEREGAQWAVPDTLIGTDSHTPMVNGIGVLAWGVGGLEAESVLFGMPVMLRLPDVVGVRLTGRLPAGTLSTDLALAVTERLRAHGVSGEFVEFFGPGVSTLSAGDRAVVANMAPEYGASSGFFPIDDATLSYLRTTGRPDDLVARVEIAAKAQGLWFDPAAMPRYSATLEMDLAGIGPSLAGPRRPQDRVTTKEVASALERSLGRPLGPRPDGGIPDGAVAIAAITSCTNTTDPALLIRAGLLARRARELGLSPPPWVKTSLAPGSPAAQRYLERSGLLDDLEAVGFGIVGFGCTTCIGNSGPLQHEMETAIRSGTAAAAVLSGNRNFPGRIHPLLQDGFLASPPLVVALALAGDLRRDIQADPIGLGRDGREVRLADLWPGDEEVEQHLRQASEPDDYRSAFAAASANAVWRDLSAPSSPQFPWDPASTYLRRPVFASRATRSRLGTFEAQPLLVLGDDITTDHISPAGQISPASYAGRYLLAHGEPVRDLNVYASRRGNWEVMVRGLFDNRSVRNMLAPDAPTGSTIHVPSRRVAPLWEIAQAYREDGTSIVIVAGERYGTGSSRDWAAKGVALLGVRAVLARSFERIHRSNLVSMGILPVLLPPSASPQALALRPGDRIVVEADRITPRGDVPLAVLRADGGREEHMGRAAVETQVETAMLRAGGIIPMIVSKALRKDRGPRRDSTAA